MHPVEPQAGERIPQKQAVARAEFHIRQQTPGDDLDPDPRMVPAKGQQIFQAAAHLAVGQLHLTVIEIQFPLHHQVVQRGAIQKQPDVGFLHHLAGKLVGFPQSRRVRQALIPDLLRQQLLKQIVGQEMFGQVPHNPPLLQGEQRMDINVLVEHLHHRTFSKQKPVPVALFHQVAVKQITVCGVLTDDHRKALIAVEKHARDGIFILHHKHGPAGGLAVAIEVEVNAAVAFQKIHQKDRIPDGVHLAGLDINEHGIVHIGKFHPLGQVLVFALGNPHLVVARHTEQVHNPHNVQRADPPQHRVFHLGRILGQLHLGEKSGAGRHIHTGVVLQFPHILILSFQVVQYCQFEVLRGLHLVVLAQVGERFRAAAVHHRLADPLQNLLGVFFRRDHLPAGPFADITHIIPQLLGQGVVFHLRNCQQMFQQPAKPVFFSHIVLPQGPQEQPYSIFSLFIILPHFLTIAIFFFHFFLFSAKGEGLFRLKSLFWAN